MVEYDHAPWGPVVALSLQSLAGTRGGLRVEHDRLLETKGVVGETSVRLVHAEEPRWSIVEEHGSFYVEHAGTTTRIGAPIVLIHLWRGGVRIVTAEGEVGVPCTRERDAREAVRLVRHLLLGVG